jgi:hypothetical protein
MTDRLSWRRAFREGQAPDVVRALCNGWADLAGSISSDTFHAGEHEHTLTEMLCEYLRDIQYKTKLTGKWSYETRLGKLERVSQRGLRVKQRKRTDIQFYSDRSDPPLDLIFEFKKLGSRGAYRKTYCGVDGMLRFITGIYAEGQPAALMVGILMEHRDDCVAPLTRWLDGAEAKAALYMETVGGRQCITPSDLLAGLAVFDTEHLRPSASAAEHGTIVISHLFLGFPNPPAPGAKRQRRAALVAALDA